MIHDDSASLLLDQHGSPLARIAMLTILYRSYRIKELGCDLTLPHQLPFPHVHHKPHHLEVAPSESEEPS